MRDVAQHGHKQPVWQIHSDTHVDFFQHVAPPGIAVKPGVQAGHCAAASHQRTDQTDRHVRARRPGVNVGIIDDGGSSHLVLRTGHVLGHRTPHAAQHFGRAQIGKRLGGTFDIGGGDHAIRPRRRDHREVHIQLARQCPDSGHRLDTTRAGACCASAQRGHLAHHRAGIGIAPTVALKSDQRRAKMHDVAGLTEQLGNAARLRRRNLHDRLGGLHRYQWLIGLDGIAHLDVPFHDLRLLQPLTEVRQFEDDHCSGALQRFPDRRENALHARQVVVLKPGQRHDHVVARHALHGCQQ